MSDNPYDSDQLEQPTPQLPTKPHPQDQAAAAAQLGQALGLLEHFRDRDALRLMAAKWLLLAGSVVVVVTLALGVVLFACPPGYMLDKGMSPSVLVAEHVSKSIALLAGLGAGFALLKIGQQLTIPLISEHGRRAEESSDSEAKGVLNLLSLIKSSD